MPHGLLLHRASRSASLPEPSETSFRNAAVPPFTYDQPLTMERVLVKASAIGILWWFLALIQPSTAQSAQPQVAGHSAATDYRLEKSMCPSPTRLHESRQGQPMCQGVPDIGRIPSGQTAFSQSAPTCVADEEVHRGVGGPIGRKAHAVALVHRAGPGVGVDVAVPGGIHLQRQHMPSDPHPCTCAGPLCRSHMLCAWVIKATR